MKKGFITQAEADEFSEKLFEQLDTKKIPGFLPSSLGEKMRAEQVNVNPYVSMTEIAKEKKSSSSGYLIQSWMRSNTTIEYLRMWEKIYNPRFQEAACDDLIHTIKTTSTTLTPSLWINTTQAMEPRQGRRDNSTSRDSNNVPGMVISGGYAGFSEMLLDGSTR